MDDAVRLGVDVGGTFTDVALLSAGELTTAKVPTTADQSVGVLRGVAAATERAGVAPDEVSTFRHATTVAVNAVLEGEGAPTALVTTAGFEDVLAIGRQDRPALYDRSAHKPDPAVPGERRHGVDERATTDGIERPVDEAKVRALAARIDAPAADGDGSLGGNPTDDGGADRTDETSADEGSTDAGGAPVEAVAVSFLHAYAHPENERRAAETLREELAVPVVASHEVLPTFREYERTSTTVVDASLRPVVADYLDRLVEGATERGLPAPRVMQGNGGVADAGTAAERAVTTVMSGPAAGVVGAAAFEPDDVAGLVTFDVGGTSSDVSLVRAGAVERTSEADVGGRPIRVPMVDVTTVGAGGGSVARVDAGGALRVGPRSAGAEPGPACYGRGGTEPTVTDAAVVLGYLGPDATLGEDLELDADAAERALSDLADEAGLEDAVAAARGVYRVTNATTARAVRSVTVERGHDPRELALAAFGGAGPMFAAALSDRLGIERVVVPPASGVLSAFGLLAADESHDAVRTLRGELGSTDAATVDAAYDDLRERVLADCSAPGEATVERRADLRYAGQSHELTVDAPEPFDAAAVRERFDAAHERARGYRTDESVELVAVRTRATIPTATPDVSHGASGDPRVGERRARFDDPRETPVLDRRRLPVDERVEGPAILVGGESTTVCPPAWTAAVRPDGALILEVDG